jgi:hypothetical protein
MNTNTVQGTYGSGRTPCDIYTYEENDGGTWYAVEGSGNVNHTYDAVTNGVDVETLSDANYFNWLDGIYSEDDLIKAVEA